MNSKRVAFLVLAVIVAGATAFLARAWLQAERAAIVAQAGGQRQVALPKPSTPGAGRAHGDTYRAVHQARGPALAAVAAGNA